MMDFLNQMPDLPLFSSGNQSLKAAVSSLQNHHNSHTSMGTQLQQLTNQLRGQNTHRASNGYNGTAAVAAATAGTGHRENSHHELSNLKSQLKNTTTELDRYKQFFSQLQTTQNNGFGQNIFNSNLSAMNLSTLTGNNSAPQAQQTTTQAAAVPKPKKTKKSKKQQNQHREDCPCCCQVNKPYQCDWPNCFKRFRQRPHLQAHQNIHTGVRFVCEFPGCGKSFVRKYNLQEHGKMHSNRNPNVCPFPDCNKFFSSKYSLTRHQAAQHQV